MKTFVTSDHHFWHSNILNFRVNSGELLRPGFQNVNHMNEYMIERWNSVVGKNDKVYHLGDFTMLTSAWALDIRDRLNGDIVLIKGNHDKAKLSQYAKRFKDVRSEHRLKTKDGIPIILTHRPILLPEDPIIFNVHGHTHQWEAENRRYINVCVEKTDYRPVEWEKIQRRAFMECRAILSERESAYTFAQTASRGTGRHGSQTSDTCGT